MTKSLLLDDEQDDTRVSKVVTDEAALSWYEVATHPLYAEYRSRNPDATAPGVLRRRQRPRA